MRILFLAIAFFLSVPTADNSVVLTSSVEDIQCISADKIVKNILHWQILSTDFVKKKKKVFVEIKAHNPLSKGAQNTPNAILTFNVNVSSGISTSNYDLVTAIFHNEKNSVVFEKIYKSQLIKNGKKVIALRVPTLCFRRKIINKNNNNYIKIKGYIIK